MWFTVTGHGSPVWSTGDHRIWPLQHLAASPPIARRRPADRARRTRLRSVVGADRGARGCGRQGRAVEPGLVWPGRIVEEHRLPTEISVLRKALGADRDLIRTVAGRGYQFTGELRVRSEGERWAPGTVTPAAAP